MSNDSPSAPPSLYKGPRSYLAIATFIIVGALLALPLFIGSASSTTKLNGIPNLKTTVNPIKKDTVNPFVPSPGQPSTRFPRLNFLSPPPPGVTVNTYQGNCTGPEKEVYNLQDTDLTVCASFTGATPGWKVIWSNGKSIAVQSTNITSADGNATFTLSPTSNLGDWRVILYEPLGGSVQVVTPFTVVDAANPTADVTVAKGPISSSTSSGSQAVFSVQVTNVGPSDAAAFQLSDAVPANTTFVSFAQLDGPSFSCANPNAGETGTSVCTISSLARGETAIFVGTYQVDSVPNGTVISNTSTASSTTSDQNTDNNSSTSELDVINAPCQLASPSNITVSADSGQSGAVVTYTTPTGTGDCGANETGENGESIPAISCNPPSGSFFPAGTTTVLCTAKTGSAVSFQVTVDNPGALSITLSGASSVTVECGTDFSDPGASAVNGSGQSIPVTVEYSPAFNPDAPAVGTYTATYTATDDPNSVSTTRTIVVSDNEAPIITVDGANPYKIITGSCTVFVDPGASALDGCAGPKAVSSSISGPGGATSVNNNVAGTYTVTYTSTDGTHQATATRTVLVGNFPEDESDQPASSDQAPTITLNGDDQIHIECGTAFSDPGATAAVCGNAVTVSTTGSVDIHTPGTYSLTYSATANNQTVEATRIVTVEADNTAPTITLSGANPLVVECHTTFTDPGATAHDACAGDFAATASGSVDPNVVGQYTITYSATDPSGFSATTITRTVNVVDTTPPTVTAPADVVINTGAGNTSCTVVVSDATLGTGSASDSCQGSLSVSRSGVPSGNVFPAGETIITYSATDASNNTGTATQKVTVIDNTNPTITLNGQTPSIWPANHRYKTFQVTDFVTGASDNCDQTVGVSSVVIAQVTSDETENGNGDGNTTNDIVIAADCKSVQLRAERNGGGNGRVYRITFRVRDAAGNTTTVSATVVVPINPGQSPDEGSPLYTVTSGCP